MTGAHPSTQAGAQPSAPAGAQPSAQAGGPSSAQAGAPSTQAGAPSSAQAGAPSSTQAGARTDSQTDALLAVLARGVRTIELGQPLFTGMPCSPNHPGFRMTLSRRHGDMRRPDGGSASSEVIITGGHVGTHIDALAHVSQDGKLHGGVDAEAAQRGGAFTELGAERIPPLMARAVLLDVAGSRGVDVLEPGYSVTRRDLEHAAERAGVQPGTGDVALVRTGWATHFSRPDLYLGQASGVPGVGEDAAEWLAALGIVATGADTTAYERIPPGAGHRTLPVHRVLLVDHGIYIMEHLDLEQAAAEGLTEFPFVVAPLRIVGGTGSPIRPFAVVGA